MGIKSGTIERDFGFIDGWETVIGGETAVKLQIGTFPDGWSTIEGEI